ncbi:MAG: PKD domain-containing protein [Pseudomonadota bacterium]
MKTITQTMIASTALLLAGCPSSDTATTEDPISTTIIVQPDTVVIRDDTEATLFQKEFQGVLGTTFSEVTSGINIDVLTPEPTQCLPPFETCESWQFSTTNARPGIYTVEGFRNIIQPSGVENRAAGTADVVVVPRDAGNAGVTQLANGSTTAMTADGTLWTINERALLAPSDVVTGTGSADAYATRFAQPADVTGLDNLTDFDSNGAYGVALRDDNTIVHWGDALGAASVNRPQAFAALNNVLADIASADGATPVSVTVDAATAADSPRSDTSDSLAAIVMSDGTVVAWYANPPAVTDPLIDGTPRRLGGVDQAIDVSIIEETMVILLSNGQVVEANRVSGNRTADAPVIITAPRRLPSISDAIAIGGRKAIRMDGQVAYWNALTNNNNGNPSGTLSPLGTHNAVSLPDPRQNLFIDASGALRYFDGPALRTINTGAIGTVAMVSGNSVIDATCGRLWTTNLYDPESQTQPGVNEPLVSYPRIGVAADAQCEGGNRSRIVYFFVTGEGSGSISSSNGSVDCRDDDDIGRVCWWFGENITPPVFTAVPDAGSQVRDWRWDCAADGAISRPVSQTPGTSQNLCKVTFDLGEAVSQPPTTRQLTINITGQGSVETDTQATSCGMTCFEYPQDIAVTLTAVPDELWVFDGWTGTNCTQSAEQPMVTVTMDVDRECIANFVQATVGEIPPVARFTISPQQPVEPNTLITFDASSSTDEDGVIVDWAWDLDNDGLIDNRGEVVTFSYPNTGYLVVRLVVSDNDGLTSEAEGIVDIVGMLSEPPTAAFDITPATTQVVGSTFSFDAARSTDDEGIIGYSWDFGNDGSFEASGEQATFTPNAPGDYEILLRVTDADGQFNDAVETITVTSNVTSTTYTLEVVIAGSGRVDVSPLNVMLPNDSCDGNQCFIFDIPAGTLLTLTATAFTPAAFDGWPAASCDSQPNDTDCVLTMNANRSVSATFR